MNYAYLIAIAILIGALITLSFLYSSSRGEVVALNAVIVLKEKQITQLETAHTFTLAETEKLRAANIDAKKIADENVLKVRAANAKLSRAIAEIRNAKDNGTVPGVVQRTLDGLRARAVGTSGGSEGAANNPG